MNKTKLFLPISILLLGLVVLLQPALAGADKPTDYFNLPETPGTYSVPGNSKLKLRVFVRNEKNSKPLTTSSLALTCGLTDPDSTATDGLTGWRLPTGTWTYRLNTSSVPSSVGSSDMATLTANAFNAWSATDVGTKVTFANGGTTSKNRASFDGQNIISWGKTSRSALAVTYTWYYTATGQVAQVDTIFNNRFAWEWSNQSVNSNCAYQNYYDAQNILTHELGHWMGLNDNYVASYLDNTMYGYGSPTEVKKNTLATGDTAAVNTLY